MNRKIVLSAVIIVILIVGLFAFISYTSLGGSGKEQKPFYVGVTYGGNNTQDAKTLIDKVKDYTNLFVIQSGLIQSAPATLNEIGDYAINAGMDVIVFFGSDSTYYMQLWLNNYDGHWGNHLLGIYFSDEPAGKMLDGEMPFLLQGNQTSFRKMSDGSISGFMMDENTTLTYYPDGKIVAMVMPNSTGVQSPINDGTIVITLPDSSGTGNGNWESNAFSVTYYPNGTTITTKYAEAGGPPISSKEGSDLPYTYDELWNARPFQSLDETAQRYTDQCNLLINRAKEYSAQFKTKYLTADYALYWFDYLGGYDTVLAELGWNNTVAQEIGLVRGAANLQGKSWGTILTWKYTQAPYLTDGEEMFSQMKVSYEAGAKYVIVFNYAEDMSGPYGTLQEQHFAALQRFWNEVVQNSTVVHGGVKAEAALVLPKNYGWGMRRPTDIIWGIWKTNSTSQQIWAQLQTRLEQYGTKLDIVYEDTTYPVAGKYANVYYWNQTT